MPFTEEFRKGFELFMAIHENWENLEKLQKIAVLNFAFERYNQSMEIRKMNGADTGFPNSAIIATAETERAAFRAAFAVEDFELLDQAITIADIISVAEIRREAFQGSPGQSS